MSKQDTPSNDVLACVKAVREYLAAIEQPISHVQGYEVVARARGLKNKHVLCAQTAAADRSPCEVEPADPSLGDDSQATKARQSLQALEGLEAHLPVEVYTTAGSTSEYGESPAWIHINLTEGLLGMFRMGLRLVSRSEVAFVSLRAWPQDWEGDTSRIDWSLTVSDDCFWYAGMPKYDPEVESHMIDFLALATLIRQGEGATSLGHALWVDGAIYWDGSGSPEELAVQVKHPDGEDEEDEEDAQEDEDDEDETD